MSELHEELNEQNDDINNQRTIKAKPNKGIIITIIIFVILGGIISVGFFNHASEINIANDKIKELEDKIYILEENLSKVDEIEAKVNALEKSYDSIESDAVVAKYTDEINTSSIARLEIAKLLIFYGVTENFITENAILAFNGDMVVDLKTQPNYASKYTGQGKFNIEDREFKDALLDINNIVKKVYDSNMVPTMNDFDDITIRYTVQNYDIGVFQNGEID